MKLEWIGGLVVVALFLGSYALVGKIAHTQGMADVQEQWDKSEKARDKQVTALKEKVASLQGEHKALSQRNSDELDQSNAAHEAALAAIRTHYEQRLQYVEKRAGVYERLSKGTATDRDRLAEHAAQLDRTLEEGRQLVGELRESLGQCEIVVGVLGTQILLDRNLLK